MRESVRKREKLRDVGVSVIEWETENKRESSGEGDRWTQCCYWPNQAVPVIHLYFLESNPFRILKKKKKSHTFNVLISEHFVCFNSNSNCS